MFVCVCACVRERESERERERARWQDERQQSEQGGRERVGGLCPLTMRD
jgi:hypothetical protein